MKVEKKVEKKVKRKVREEGIEKGREEGIGKCREEVALRMLQQNMELQLISQLTGLSIEQLQKLKK